MQAIELLRNAIRQLAGRALGEDYRQPRHTVAQTKVRGHEADILALPLDTSSVNASPLQSQPMAGGTDPSPTVASSPPTLEFSGAMNTLLADFMIPSGVWTVSNFEILGTRNIPGFYRTVTVTIPSTGNHQTLFMPPSDTSFSKATTFDFSTELNAAAGGNLQVQLSFLYDPGTIIDVTAFNLLMTGTPGPAVPSQFYFMPDYDMPDDPNILIL